MTKAIDLMSNSLGKSCLAIALLAIGFQANAETQAINGIEYVNVRDEPQHHHEYENELVRIYDVVLPPRHVTLYHAHYVDTIYAIVRGSTMQGKVLIGGSPSLPEPITVPSGFVAWNGHTKEPLIHQVTNKGEQQARLVGVEIKIPEQKFENPALASPGLILKETYKNVRVYELALAPGGNVIELDINFSGLIIALTESSVSLDYDAVISRTASFEPASWEWLDKPGKIKISNVGASAFKALLYELP